MSSNLNFRSPTVMTAIGIGATLVVTATVVVVLLRFGGGAKAVSDNAALIGALIALGGVFTTQMVNSALEAQRAEQARDTAVAQRERELVVGEQRAQDDALEKYLDQMGQLLLDKDNPLYQSKEGDAVRTLARARTLTVLSKLDGDGKGSVLQFLYESDLITKGRMVVQLTGADLGDADLSGANLSGADLSRADLSDAYLSGAYLRGADLSSADLRDAYLSVSDADLSGADLSSADLSGANLSDAYLRGVDLSGANLFEANLSDAKGVTNEQLRAANSLEEATMPDGQPLKSAANPDGPTFEDWLREHE